MRVLVVEDELIIALDIESLVIDSGHEVCGLATTSEEAVRLAYENRPDLILSDISLARGSSGITAAREIVARLGTLIVFISAGIAMLTRDDLDVLTPIALLSKPVIPSRVHAALSKAELHLIERQSTPQI